MDSEHRYAMLVQIGQPGALKYMAFIGQSLTWLQLTDRSTAEAEKAAIMETSITSRDADAFEMKARVCTTDGASSKCVTERSISIDRGPSWLPLHLICVVHKVANGYKSVFGMVEDIISGMINLSLSLASSADMGRFRRILADEVASRIRFTITPPSAEAVAYQTEVLNLFMSGPRMVNVRRHLLQMVRGDWRLHDRIEVYTATPLMDADKLEAKRNVVRIVTFC